MITNFKNTNLKYSSVIGKIKNIHVIIIIGNATCFTQFLCGFLI